MLVTGIFSFSQNGFYLSNINSIILGLFQFLSANALNLVRSTFLLFCKQLSGSKHQCRHSPFPKQQFLDSCRQQFWIQWNGRKFFERVETLLEKGEIAHYKQFLIFPQCFKRLILQTQGFVLSQSLNSSYLKEFAAVFPFCATFLAPLAEGQRAIVMALCPSCVHSSVRASVNFFFKKLLLRNYWLDFYQISQECSFGGPLLNSFK